MTPEDHEEELTMEEVARQIEEADMGLSDMEELPEVESCQKRQSNRQ